jgi:hypothetical protein
MPTGILRVNYRKTGGVADLTTLGNAIAKSSALGGAGTNVPNGGLIFITSYYVSVMGAGTTSGVVGDSALGIMSAFYGSGIYGAGYAIQPIAVVPLSLTAVAYTSPLIVTSLRTSSSMAIFNAFVSGSIGVSNNMVYTLLALVISGP